METKESSNLNDVLSTESSDEVKLLKQKVDEEINRRVQVEKTKRSFDDYVRGLKLYTDVPHDQFGHQFKLLFHPTIEISDESKRADLFNPEILLGNIKDSKTLYFLQRDFAILHRLYDMGLRSQGVMDLFNNLYYAWVGQIRLTGALGGNERLLQSFLEPTQQMFESFSYLQKQQQKKQRGGGFRNFLKRRGGGGGEESGVYGD